MIGSGLAVGFMTTPHWKNEYDIDVCAWTFIAVISRDWLFV
jgi:hypothetical protein